MNEYLALASQITCCEGVNPRLDAANPKREYELRQVLATAMVRHTSNG